MPWPVFAPADRFDDKVEPAAMQANQATSMQMSADDTAAIFRHAAGGTWGINVALWGAIGYCMGGRHAISAATAHPQQVRAALSVHGGRLVDDTGDSPHHMIGRSSVPLHYLFARDDATCPPEHQALIAQAAASMGGRVRTEILDAHHGWAFPARWCFDRRASDRTWECALALFRSALWTPHQPLAG